MAYSPIKQLHNIEQEKTTNKILRESVQVLAFSSIISAFGGIGLELVREKLLLFIPFLILVPAMNEMVGGFGAIVTSRFTTALFTKQLKRDHIWTHPFVQSLFTSTMTAAVITALYMGGVAYLLAIIKGFPFNIYLFVNVLAVSLLATIVLVTIIFLVSILGGLYVHKKGHDPDNYLIPLATGIADLGSMLVLALVLLWLF
ncbi:magnesium transporter [Candidatus Woesearchaeota archaeon]|nr:magnesium transporter [Candidatus Woesearchaeota archaeon]